MKKWHEVYNQTSEERNFFVGKDGKSGLVRASYVFRSVAALMKESGLTREQVERIVDKYLKLGIAVASPNKEDHYGYWERIMLAGPATGGSPTIAQADQGDRAKARAKNMKTP